MKKETSVLTQTSDSSEGTWYFHEASPDLAFIMAVNSHTSTSSAMFLTGLSTVNKLTLMSLQIGLKVNI